MKDIFLRDVDEDVLERLERRANKQGRTLKQELKRIVERAARVGDEDFWSVMNVMRGRMRVPSESPDEENQPVSRDEEEPVHENGER